MKTLAISFDRGAFVLKCGNARVTLANNGEGATILDADAYARLLSEMRGERIRAKYSPNLEPMGLRYMAEQIRKYATDLIGRTINWPQIEACEKVYNAFVSAGIEYSALRGAIVSIRYIGLDPSQISALASAYVGAYHEIERFKRAHVDNIVADNLETPLEWERLFHGITPNVWRSYKLAADRTKCEHDRALLFWTAVKCADTNGMTNEQVRKAFEMMADAISSGEYLIGLLGRMSNYFDTRRYSKPNSYIRFIERTAARNAYDMITTLIVNADRCGIGLRFPFTFKDTAKTARLIIEASALRVAKGQRFANGFHDAMNGFECAGLCVVVPETYEEFADEAKQQHNCVAGYYDAVQNGKTNVCFIRSKNEKQNSLLTCEVSNTGEIVQFLAKNNKKPNMNDESVSTFLRVFMDKIAETFNQID